MTATRWALPTVTVCALVCVGLAAAVIAHTIRAPDAVAVQVVR